MSVLTHLNIECLPNGWRRAFFGDLVAFHIGKTPPRHEKIYWDDAVFPWVSISDMPPYGTIVQTAESVSDVAHRKIFRGQLAPAGHMLMSFKLTIGRVARLGIPAYHNEAIISFRPDHPDVNEDFLFYYLSQIDYGSYRDKAIKGDTLNKSKLKMLAVALPPLGEQRQIAVVLSAVQRAIELQERLIALTIELKKALMHKLFTEGTRGEPLKQTEIGLVPESWPVAPLAHFTDSFQYGTSVKCGYALKGSPVLRIPNAVGGHLDMSDLKFGVPKKNELESVRLRPGDLLFVRTNGVRENAGRCSMYRGELGDSCYFASYLIRVRLNDGLIPGFLEEYTRTKNGVRLLSGRAARTADGKFNINTGTLETLLVPKPEVEEQKLIVDSLTSIDKKARNHAASKATLEALFRTLLHQLMTGKLRIHDVDLSVLQTAEAVGAA